MSGRQDHDDGWLRAFVPLGVRRGDQWTPVGGAVLLLDHPMVWLVTASEALRGAADDDVTAWVPRESGAGLLNVSDSHRQVGIAWIHHPVGLSATLFPVDDSFRIKAFTETQCTRLRDLKRMQPVVSVGGLYGPDVAPSPSPEPAVMDGIVASTDPRSGSVLTTAPLLPRNLGAPLLLASPYGGTITLAGVLLGHLTLPDTDPRRLPARLSRAICVDAAFELIRGRDADRQRELAGAAPGATTPPPIEGRT